MSKFFFFAGGAGSRRGTGGMKTKLQAAKLATNQGIDTIITNGKNPETLYKIIKRRNRWNITERKKNMKSYLKYFAVLFLFGLNGIVANKILLKSYEIVF